jgi:hypothetical protein
MFGAAGTTTVSAANLTDASGNKISNCTIWFQPCNSQGKPLSFQGGGGGQATDLPVSAQVTTGAFSITLADTTLTYPVNISYSVSIVDNASGNELLGPGYQIQPFGATWDFDSYLPNLPNLATIQNGPQGPPGTITLNSGASISDGLTVAGGLNADTVTVSGLVSDSQLQAMPIPNNLGIVRGWVDSTLKVIFALKADGTIVSQWLSRALAAILPSGATVSGSNLTLTGVNRDAEIQNLPIPNNLGVVRVMVDQFNRLIFGWNSDGSVQSTGFLRQMGTLISGSATVLGRQDRVEVAESGTYYTALDGSSNSQIWRIDTTTGAATQLTTLGSNTAPSVSQDGSYITFLTNRTGTLLPYRMDRYGNNQVPIAVNPAKANTLNHIIGTGQSLAIGTTATVLTTSQPFANLMFNSGVTCATLSGTVNTEIAVTSPNIASFSPLVEGVPVTGAGETFASGFANRATNDLLQDGIAHRILMSISAQGGTAYSGLARGTICYSNTIAEVTAAHTLAIAAGYSQAVRAMIVVHGEQDEKIGNTNYTANLQTWRSNYESDIQAITGQLFNIPMILDQLSSFTADNTSETQGIIPMQQIAAWKANPSLFIPALATYFITHAGDNIHLPAYGYRLMGEYFARVYRAILQGQNWFPLYPKWTQIAKIGTQLLIPFYVPEPPLVFDTTTLTQPSFVSGSRYGFEVYNSSGTAIAITAAQIVGKDQDKVLLTLASDPGNGASVAYAFTGAAGGGGGPQGPRGNLRDSAVETSYYPYNGTANYPLWNWCLHFKETIPTF